MEVVVVVIRVEIPSTSDADGQWLLYLQDTGYYYYDTCNHFQRCMKEMHG